ncbi:MAG: RluA family pseudouridine synthase [Saprospiraceae bacterium]|nr:RluA family pseudouridine synthase [Saprospiraceae bacterium]
MRENENIKVLYEDNHLIAVNKPTGWLVQGDQTGDETLSDWVKNYIKVRYEKPGDVFLGVIHRLDRPVSGTIVFARTSKALERMNKLFHDREVQKTYWAIVNTRPEPLKDKLIHYLLKDPETNTVRAFNKPKGDAKLAELEYELIGEIGEHCCLEVNPLTGRPHQIRVQLSKMGYPIRGDLKYGSKVTPRNGAIYLHSRSLAFEHPIKKEPVLIVADVPREQIWNLFALK